MAAVEMSEVSG